MRATRSWPPSCHRARRSKRSSRHPDQHRRGAAEQEGHDVGPGDPVERGATAPPRRRRGRARWPTTRKATPTAMPPPRGIGLVLTRRSSGWSTASTRRARRRTTGVRSEGQRPPPRGRRRRRGRGGPRRSPGRPRAAVRHASGSPGTGKRAQMSRTSAAIRACSAGSSRVRSASTSSRPTSRISAGPKPRVVVAGVPTRIPEVDVRRRRVERDGVLVDGDADIVEEPLGLLARSPRRAARRPRRRGCRSRRR